MNVVTVKINGLEYNLKGEESENYIFKVSELVNDTIAKIKSKNSMLSSTDVAALASVRIADEFLKVLEEKDVIQCQARDIFERNATLNEELKNSKKALEELAEKNTELVQKNSKLSNEEHVLEYERKIASLKSQLDIIEEKSKEYIKENSDLKEQNSLIEQELLKEKESNKGMKEKHMRLNQKLVRMENELIDSNIALAKTLQGHNRK